MEKYTIHSGSAADIDFLWEMLYQAIYVPEGVERPSRAIIKDPALEKYVRNWGRDGDIALIALDETGNHVGAIWTRLFNEKNQTMVILLMILLCLVWQFYLIIEGKELARYFLMNC
ncbi:hypothetical protein [Virgibacillus salarius]|uniref:hypothetical protein n=1 Tax=Virgibacillus salarius TaxID=447199 RepID=UPI001FE75B58|nr:hypothetical protein [Virgibacillus salarius]